MYLNHIEVKMKAEIQKMTVKYFHVRYYCIPNPDTDERTERSFKSEQKKLHVEA